jgi:hypothetical protein
MNWSRRVISLSRVIAAVSLQAKRPWSTGCTWTMLKVGALHTWFFYPQQITLISEHCRESQSTTYLSFIKFKKYMFSSKHHEKSKHYISEFRILIKQWHLANIRAKFDWLGVQFSHTHNTNPEQQIVLSVRNKRSHHIRCALNNRPKADQQNVINDLS